MLDENTSGLDGRLKRRRTVRNILKYATKMLDNNTSGLDKNTYGLDKNTSGLIRIPLG